MLAATRTALERRFRAGEWYGHSRMTDNLLAVRHRLTGAESPDWSLTRGRTVALPPARRSSRFSSAVPTAPIRVFGAAWTPIDAPAGTMVLTDVFTYPSLEAAHEAVLVLLGRFESPNVAWRPDSELGDVAFGAPTMTSPLVFARANLVYFVRNAGARLVDAELIARQLDDNLVSRPGPDVRLSPSATASIRSLRDEPRGRRSRRKEPEGNPDTWLVDLHSLERTLGAEAAPVWFKVFSPHAKLSDRDGNVECESPAGDPRLTVYAVDPLGGHTAATARPR